MNDIFTLIVSLHEALSEHQIPHAFGGALALAFHVGEPRATRDIDLNVFVAPTMVADVVAALPNEIHVSRADENRVRETGQVRVFWGETPIDLFFSNHRFHDDAVVHVVKVPLGAGEIPILDATTLTIFKAYFDRTKDWADIEAMALEGTVDGERATRWMDDLLGVDDHRSRRVKAILAAPPPGNEPVFST